MKQIQAFKLLGRFEALSLLLLFFVAMPLKYMYAQPQYVRVIGMIHGLLFLAYGCFALVLNAEERWKGQKLLACLILSCLPFGTFVFEKKYLGKKGK